MTKNVDDFKFSNKEISEAVNLNNSFAETGKKYKKVYGIDGIKEHQLEIDRLISQGWEVIIQSNERIMLGCNSVINTYLGEEGLLRFEYGSNL